MKFSKLLLASAIAMSASAFAMEDMTEDAMSATTGQDGVTVTIVSPTTSYSMVVHDGDGYTGFTGAGAILIGDPTATGTRTKASLATPASGIVLTIDASSGAGGTAPLLNIGVAIASGTVIHTGDIAVGKAAAANGSAVSLPTSVFMKDMAITLGATTANIQLGNVDGTQTTMVKLDTTMTGGLSIANFTLSDTAASGTGDLAITNIGIKDTAGGANLTVKATASIKPAGLFVTLAQFGVAGVAGGVDVQLQAVKLGTPAAIGNIDIIGLQMSGTTVTIAGH